MLREIEWISDALPAVDGDGVDLQRNSFFDGRLDPFLMLDEIKAAPNECPNAFPVHPHRGIQTLTYLIHGSMSHTDSMGNASEIQAGDLQWMHTGRGIEHSEKPGVDENGLWGFQFWLNVPHEEKFAPPKYQDIGASQTKAMDFNGVEAKLLAGSLSINGQPVLSDFRALAGKASLLDLHWHDRQLIDIATFDKSAGLFVMSHEIHLVVAGGALKKIPAGKCVGFTAGEHIQIHAEPGARILFFSGEPIGEPIVHRGPFVMTTEAEITDTINAYRQGTLVSA